MDHGELGRKLLEIREAQAMSQRDVAARTPDLTPTGISRIERGERYPNLNTLEALAKVLRLEITVDPLGTRIKRLT